MREIKFRAWHSGQNKYYSAEEMARDQLTLLPTGKFINVNSRDRALSIIYNSMIPEQFTGLRDKNGKEIYEGDIVNHDNETFVVEFYAPSFRYKSLLFEGYITPNFEMADCSEVIGNIHENPELIK